MDRLDLTRVADRLEIARRIFDYPLEPHRRRHGPRYTTYDSYREWLRDEFSFRCAYSLLREEWIGREAQFDIEHIQPQSARRDLVSDYDNLLYVTHRANLVRGKRPLPNPCEIAFGKCVAVDSQTGEIRSLNPDGQRLIRILKLDSMDATRQRLMWLQILRNAAEIDVELFRRLVGYPPNLIDLPELRENSRPGGIAESAAARRKAGTLPDWY